jgi:hypothetical protein
LFSKTGPALGGAAVILFERYEQKDKSGTPDPAPSQGNAQIKRKSFQATLLKNLGLIVVINHVWQFINIECGYKKF